MNTKLLLPPIIWVVSFLHLPGDDLACRKEVDRWVPEIAEKLSRDSIWYDARKGTDCSGMLHRVFDSLAVRCEDLKLPKRNYRDSRAIAAYYQENKKLHIFADPMKVAQKLQPGTVLFFSYSPVSQAKKKKLPEGICHVGIVTRVLLDDLDRVQSIDLFHGRRPGTVATISTLHPGKKSSDAFRNGSQYWVAYAVID